MRVEKPQPQELIQGLAEDTTAKNLAPEAGNQL